AVVRRMILRRRVTGFLRLGTCAGDEAAFTRCLLAGFENAIAETAAELADSGINARLQWVKTLGRIHFEPPVLRRRDARDGLEGAVERAKRLEARVHGDGDDGHFGLCWIGERSPGFRDPMVVQEDVEVAIAE